MKHLYAPLLSILMLGTQSIKAQVQVSNGANVLASSGANVVLNNISLNHGNTPISGDGKILFTGNSATTTISGNSIKNIVLNKTAGTSVKLLSNLTLSGTLQLISGKLDLNSYDLNLGTTGSLSDENENSYVTGNSGFVIRQATLNAPTTADPGNLGLSITSSSNLGNTTIKRGNYALSDGSNFSINRFFDVIPTNNTALNATVKLKYLDTQLNGLQENQLKFLTSANAGSTWSEVNTATLNTTNNEIEATGLATLNRITLASNFTTLPISAIYVSGKQTGNGVALNWHTVNETEVSHFWVEKSTDGKLFKDILKVASLSHTKKDNVYWALDKNPIAGNNYYRIRAVDYDGKTTTSLPLVVTYSLTNNSLLAVYPNPTTKLLNGSFYTDGQTQATLQVISNLGRVEITQQMAATTGLNDFSINVSTLPPGTYYLKLTHQNNYHTAKFIKK